MKKVKIFNDFEAYETWTDKFDDFEYCYTPCLIDDGWKISMDVFIDCKSWKTALNRFKKAFGDYSEDVKAWIDGMYESCENGYMHDECYYSACESDKELCKKYGSYGWAVEQVDDGRFYIFLNISGEYAGYHEAVA